ncbi:DUF397 domain-containing protein [Nonomuraea sp. NPDC050540]|uniref:DUF397 domain-containing protein n=1 Tax=Nonomuraea sp. NPDC050540 TaxID=3364367 RepID=UPI0037B2D2DC
MSELTNGKDGFTSACEGGNCIQVKAAEYVQVRISTNPEGPVLLATRDEWTAFVTGVKLGWFDTI